MAEILDKNVRVTRWAPLEVEMHSHSAATEPRHRMDETKMTPEVVDGVITMQWTDAERSAFMEGDVDAINALLDAAVVECEPDLRVTRWRCTAYESCVSFRPFEWERR